MRNYVAMISFTAASDTDAGNFFAEFTDRILNGEITNENVGNVEMAIVPDGEITDEQWDADEAFCERESDFVPNPAPIPEEIAHLDN